MTLKITFKKGTLDITGNEALPNIIHNVVELKCPKAMTLQVRTETLTAAGTVFKHSYFYNTRVIESIVEVK